MSKTIDRIVYSNRNRVCEVILIDSEKLHISVDLVVKFQLSKNMVIDDDVILQIKAEQRIIEVKQTAYSIATFRLRPTAQIIRKLKDKLFEDAEIEVAISFLNEFNLLNDKQFAISFIKDSLLKKPVSSFKMKMELFNLGLDKYLVDDIIDEYYPKDDEFSLALKSAEKKMRLISNKSPQKQRNALYNYLAGQGYNHDIIKQVLAEYKIEASDTSIYGAGSGMSF